MPHSTLPTYVYSLQSFFWIWVYNLLYEMPFCSPQLDMARRIFRVGSGYIELWGSELGNFKFRTFFRRQLNGSRQKDVSLLEWPVAGVSFYDGSQSSVPPGRMPLTPSFALRGSTPNTHKLQYQASWLEQSDGAILKVQFHIRCWGEGAYYLVLSQPKPTISLTTISKSSSLSF